VRLPYAGEAKTIHAVVAAVRRAKRLRPETLKVAQRADQAAGAVEQGLKLVAKQQAVVRAARHRRDALARLWTTEVAALKRRAGAAEDEGAHRLHATLFERPKPSVPTRRRRTPTSVASTQPIPPDAGTRNESRVRVLC